MIYDVVIIGGGLGGLQCGKILSQRGQHVCVLEKEHQAGGCLQTFGRNGATFDTGFHYVGGLGSGEPLGRVMRYLGLDGLPWQRLDREGYDEIVIGGESYMLANGERFTESLADRFPHQRANIEKYAAFCREVREGTFDPLDNGGGDLYRSLFAEPAYDYLRRTFDDERLIEVVSGASMKLETRPETLPLYTFAQTNASYIGSAWRLRGGGSLISDTLADGIRKAGGDVLTKREVAALETDGERITAAVTTGGERFEGRTFISGLHPASTSTLLEGAGLARKSYVRRMGELGNTWGAFTVNIKLKEGALPYLNRNIHIHSGESSIWQRHQAPSGSRPDYVMAHYYVPDDGGGYAPAIDLLRVMTWDEVARWEGTKVGRRGEEYTEFKESKAQECIEIASGRIPGLREAIDRYYTSTPLTWRDYTGTPQGSAFGIRKDYARPEYTVLPARTPAPNLYMTGQNLSVHGLLGVSVTSLMTCMQVPEAGDVWRGFNESTR